MGSVFITEAGEAIMKVIMKVSKMKSGKQMRHAKDNAFLSDQPIQIPLYL